MALMEVELAALLAKEADRERVELDYELACRTLLGKPNLSIRLVLFYSPTDP